MKSLSAAIVVTAGAAIVVSSQLCEALIRRSFGAWDSSIVIYGLALGTTMIAVGVLGCSSVASLVGSSRHAYNHIWQSEIDSHLALQRSHQEKEQS